MRLREAVELMLANPCKKGLQLGDGMVMYYDPTWDDEGVRILGAEICAAGNGISFFSISDVLRDDYVVVDIDEEPWKKTEKI